MKTNKQTPEERKQKQAEYFQLNKEKIYKQRREYQKEYHRERRKTDPLFKWSHERRIEIKSAIKSKSNDRYLVWLDCTTGELKQYIEKQFTDNMNWDNFGSEYEIDHIIPLSSAKTVDQMLEVAHVSNIRVISVKENRKKWSNI